MNDNITAKPEEERLAEYSLRAFTAALWLASGKENVDHEDIVSVLKEFQRDNLEILRKQQKVIDSLNRTKDGVTHICGTVEVHCNTIEDYNKFKKIVGKEAVKEFASSLIDILRPDKKIIENSAGIAAVLRVLEETLNKD